MLTPDLILKAYRAGLFPMAESRNDTGDLAWYDPRVRGVLPIAGLHVPARLRRLVRRGFYTVTFDRDFSGVIRACADAREKTWINDAIIDLYTQLHRTGDAHSIEAWHGDRLAGGLYGVAIGGAFFGESMFSVLRDASKVALVHLAARLWTRGFTLLDAQFPNAHLRQFGLEEIPRAEYRARLDQALRQSPVFGGAPSAPAGVSAAGAVSGAFSDENVSGLAGVELFLQSITQTS